MKILILKNPKPNMSERVIFKVSRMLSSDLWRRGTW